MEGGPQYNVQFPSIEGRDHNSINQYGVQNVYNPFNQNLKQELLHEFGAVDPDVERTRILASKDVLLEGSCDWVLEDPAFTSWWDGEKKSNILWIHGDPGKGKTMIISALIDEISQRLKASSDDTHGLAFFFCQSTDARLKTANAVLSGLIYSLMRQYGVFLRYMLDNHHPKKEGQGTGAGASFWSLWTMLESFFQRNPDTKVYLCIDALDECATDMITLLESITRTQSKNVNWLLTSRNEPLIRERLEFAGYGVHTSLELNSTHVERTVERFITSKVETLSRQKRYSPELKGKIERCLRENAKGTFLWVALVCKVLEGRFLSNWQVESKLRLFPPGLEALYEQMLYRIKDIEDFQTREMCQRVLRTVAVAFRPLTLLDIAIYAELPEEITYQLEWLEEVVSYCGSFLIVREGTVYFVHQSAKDFLRRETDNLLFLPDISEECRRFATKSFEIMSTKLIRNICGIEEPGTFLSEVTKDRTGKHLPSHLQYACVFGITHMVSLQSLGKLQPHEIHDEGQLHRFLRSHCLHWLEALSWMEQISSAVDNISELLEAIDAYLNQQKSDSSRAVRALLHDTERFLATFRSTIELSPLQIYCSALVFTPSNSVIKKTFRSEGPAFLRSWPNVQEDWGSFIRSFETHGSYEYARACVAINRNGSLVTSAHGVDKRLFVHIWESRNGNVVSKIDLGEYIDVRTMAFSNDSTFLAVGVQVWDRYLFRLFLWDVRNRRPHHVFSIPQNAKYTEFVKVFFSLDDSSVISVLRDGTVHRGILTSEWGRETKQPGAARMTCWAPELEAHAESEFFPAPVILDSVLSSSGNLVVLLRDFSSQHWDISGPIEEPFTLLDTSAFPIGTTTARLTILSQGLDKVAQSVGRDVKIYSSATDAITVLELGMVECCTMETSADGALLACGTYTGEIFLYDLRTGALKASHKASDDKVFSLSFASDPGISRLASVHSDGIAILWDSTTSEKMKHSDSGSEDFPYTSTCTDFLAIASRRGIVKVLNLRTGIPKLEIETKSLSPSNIELSPNGKLIAIGFDTGLVWLWDVTNDRYRYEITGGSSQVAELAFSSNVELLASISFDHELSIWEVSTGQLKRRFHVGTIKMAVMLCFSTDNESIAIASEIGDYADPTIRIWSIPFGKCICIIHSNVEGLLLQSFSFDESHLYLEIVDLESHAPSEVRRDVYELATGECVRQEVIKYVGNAPYFWTSFEALQNTKIGLSEMNQWILIGGKRAMRLPRKYQRDAYALVDETVVLMPNIGSRVEPDFLRLDTSRLSTW